MNYLKIIFSLTTSVTELRPIAQDVLAEQLGNIGFEAFEEAGNEFIGYIQKELFDKSRLDEELAAFPIEGVSIGYQSEEMENKDWNAAWEEDGFEPIVIDDAVTIYDAYHTDAAAISRLTTPVNVGIEARQAFGTGTHQTTRMVVRTMLNIEMNGLRVLDCGCGTGILSIVASKLGAESVVAYDIDEWSVENTRHNAQLNGVENIEVFSGDASVLTHVSGVFDVVLANINRNILIHDMGAFKEAMRTNSLLVLSGFYAADAPLIAETAREQGLTIINSRTEDDWCCLILK